MDKLFTGKEEIELGKIIKEGTSPLEIENAKKILRKENTPLLISIASKIKNKYHPELSVGELISEGYSGLEKAVNKFDPMKGKFSTFASTVIENCLIDFIRKNCGESPNISFDDPENKIPLIERMADERVELPPDKMIQQEEDNQKRKENNRRRKEAKEILYLLKQEERIVVKGKAKKRSNSRIGESLNVGPERVKHVHRKAKRKIQCLTKGDDLREELQGAGILNLVIFALDKSGVLPFEEFAVKEKKSDEALIELITNIEREEGLVRNSNELTEDQKKQGLMHYRISKSTIQGVWDQVKDLKMRGDHIFFPPKTKPKRENVFKAVTYLRAIFNEAFGTLRWDLIERIISAYCPEVFRGGSIESWYYNREKEDFKYFLIDGEEREKFFLDGLKAEYSLERKVSNDN